MREFTLEEFTRDVVRTLEDKNISNNNITTSNPDTTELYPLGVVSNPMENIIMTSESNIPIRKRFGITIEWWTDSKYHSMQKYNEGCNLLRAKNILSSGGTYERYDEITKKHIFGSSYEVYYNGLTNSYEKTK